MLIFVRVFVDLKIDISMFDVWYIYQESLGGENSDREGRTTKKR